MNSLVQLYESGECSVCGQDTFHADAFFEERVCPGKCYEIKWEEYGEQTKKVLQESSQILQATKVQSRIKG